MAEQWRATDHGDDIWYVRDGESIAVARCRDHESAEQIIADHNIAEAARAYYEAFKTGTTMAHELSELQARVALFAAIDRAADAKGATE